MTTHPHGTHVEPNGYIRWGWVGKTVVGIMLASCAALSGGVTTYVIQNERRITATEGLARITSELLRAHVVSDVPYTADHVTNAQLAKAISDLRESMEQRDQRYITRDEMNSTLRDLRDSISVIRSTQLRVLERLPPVER